MSVEGLYWDHGAEHANNSGLTDYDTIPPRVPLGFKERIRAISGFVWVAVKELNAKLPHSKSRGFPIK